MQGKTKILLIIIIVLLVAAGSYYFFQKHSEKEEEVKSFGSQIFDAVKGPAERIPETNPFKKVKLNPFE